MYRRDISIVLESRLKEPRKFMQVVVGPRQTGKTTAINQAVQTLGIPTRYVSADGLSMRGTDWIELEWMQARTLSSENKTAVLIIDEIQKVKQWSEAVKRLWDEDSWNNTPLMVVLSGSSSLLFQKGLSESLAGRYEVIRSTHWNLSEMRAAFGYSMEDYLDFGGYPGSAFLKDHSDRWKTYMRDSIIESTISRDVLQMEDVRKPVLLRRLFELGVQYSSQEISYRNLLGQLDDKGNTATIAHYLDLLSAAGMISGLQKYEPKLLTTRKSSPRLLAHDTSLMTASWEGERPLLEDPVSRGHLVETAVGATLLARGIKEGFDLFWWRDGSYEVDFVVRKGKALYAIEVKSGKVGKTKGLAEFCSRFPAAKPLVIGDVNTSLENFLLGEVPLFPS